MEPNSLGQKEIGRTTRHMKRITKLLRHKDHEIYEIWCEWAAESVYFSGKPTQKELEEVVLLNWKLAFEVYQTDTQELSEFIKRFISVEPLKRLYAPAQ